jgi:hypothetical protein
MSEQTDFKRKKFRTGIFLLLMVIVLYVGVFFFKDL